MWKQWRDCSWNVCGNCLYIWESISSLKLEMYSDFLRWFNHGLVRGCCKNGGCPKFLPFWDNFVTKASFCASWSPSCFSKYGGSWNLTSHETPTLFLLFFGSYGRKIPCAQCWWKVGSVGLLLKKTPYLLWFNYPPSEPPPLAGSQAVWPWLNPPRGHHWHVAGSKNGTSFCPLPLGLKFFNHEME